MFWLDMHRYGASQLACCRAGTALESSSLEYDSEPRAESGEWQCAAILSESSINNNVSNLKSRRSFNSKTTGLNQPTAAAAGKGGVSELVRLDSPVDSEERVLSER